MRKLIRLIISVSVTFSLGVSLSNLWTYYFPNQVTLCTLARNPAAFHQRVVKVIASASVTSSPIFDSNYLIVGEAGCNEPDGWATVKLDESYKPSAEVEAFIGSPNREIRKAQIVVVGQFDQAATMGCFAPKFGITATSIRLVSPVLAEPLPKMPRRDAH
jgi:hypothetical protein